MKVRYTVDSLLQIAAIHAYINERNPLAATRVAARIRSAAERLGELPEMGHPGALAGTREWAVVGLPYIIVREVDQPAAEVVILGIYHGAQLRLGQD